MTNQEAITKLTNIMHDDHYSWHPSILEAFRMAVDALKGAKGDCINRADVNRVLEDWFRTVFGTDSFRKTGLCRELRELPSAQPSFPQDHEKDHFAEAGKKATQPDVPDTNVGDTISRQAAIDEIKALYEWHDTVTEDRTIDHLKRLPSAQPETAKRIVGKSRDGMTLWYQCDMCNEPVDAQDNYCRGCGRRLIDE